MTLRTKFTLLVLVFVTAVGLSIGVAEWTTRVFERELTETFRSLTSVLEDLDELKQWFEVRVQSLDPDLADPTHSGAEGIILNAETLRTDLESWTTRLQTSALVKAQAGVTTSQTIISRVRHTGDLLTEAVVLQAEGSLHFRDRFLEAKSEFEGLHSLIERVEKRLLLDVDLALAHGIEIRRLIRRVNFSSFALAALGGVLAVLLFNRWVIRSIRELRHATDELAAGNFAYRIPVQGSDELARLSDEVNQMASTIVRIQNQLVERERLAAIGEMMRRVVHNLRNPLAGIRSLAELTHSSLPNDAEEREYQSRILTTVDRFEQWLREVVRSTQHPDISPESQEIAPALARVLEAHEAVASTRRIRLELACDAGARATFDSVHLGHAVSALVGNSIEATPEGGRVLVSAEAIAGQGLRVRVDDSGPGVDPALADRVFVPYFTTKRDGTGIGLAVVRNVAVAHGGSVRLEPSKLGGAAFIIEIGRTSPASGGQGGQNSHHRG